MRWGLTGAVAGDIGAVAAQAVRFENPDGFQPRSAKSHSFAPGVSAGDLPHSTGPNTAWHVRRTASEISRAVQGIYCQGSSRHAPHKVSMPTKKAN